MAGPGLGGVSGPPFAAGRDGCQGARRRPLAGTRTTLPAGLQPARDRPDPPLLAATEWLDARPLWSWDGIWAWVSNGLGALALAGIVWSSRAYDLREFLGLGPRRPLQVLGLSAAHRFVRHPWYFLGLVWLWTRDMDGARLMAAAVITVYVAIGSYLEDRKLEQTHGAAYRRYRRQVPGLLPRPWRYLSRSEYERLRGRGPG